MNAITRPAHSPLGASGAERWMECPGSVALLNEMKLPESDEPDYRIAGTAAHAALEKCLREGLDGWEIMGEEFNGIKADVTMADAIQVFLDTVRPAMTPAAKTYIEYGIDNPEFHPLFYGTVDYGVIDGTTLAVNDFKYGEGVLVEAAWNPQIMYYAYGLLQWHPEVTTVVCRIIQPRGFHPEGPVRAWEIDADVVRKWAVGELRSAMIRAEIDHTLTAGPWCRFCPAKLVCPLLTGLFKAAATANEKDVIELSSDMLGLAYQHVPAVKSYIKALEEETYRRLNLGQEVQGTKLVHKKANRVYKDGAAKVFVDKFGEEALTTPELKSPAEIEKLGSDAKALVKEWAYTPESGLTVALEGDKKPGVKVKSMTETFAAAIAKELGVDMQSASA